MQLQADANAPLATASIKISKNYYEQANKKLELTWIVKNKRPKLEPRILLEEPDKSYRAKHRVADNDIFDNKMIFGDNL